MNRSLLYKEWLKIRWTVYLILLVGLVTCALNYLTIYNNLKYVIAPLYWHQVIFSGRVFYESFYYLPLFMGLALAAAQFLPEMYQERLRLLLHLPYRESTLLQQMLLIGTATLFLIFCFTLGLLLTAYSVLFPGEIVTSAFLTLLPKFLAGFAGYFALSSVILEPTWMQRVLNLLIGYAFISTFFLSSWYETYRPALPLFLICTAVLSGGFFLSGNRFKQGKR